MSPVKEAVIKLVQSLPDDCTLQDIQYHLYVRAKVEAGERDIAAGNVLTQEEAEREIAAWLQSFGPARP
jgi:predicted transcriptional regulator